MCATCGCGDEAGTRVTLLGAEPERDDHDDHGQDGHEHGHGHGPGQHTHEEPAQAHDDAQPGGTVVLEQKILAKNAALAQLNRGWLQGRDILAINLMSSPGSGKTTLLEQTISGAPAGRPIAVIEGDQETPFDAERIRASGRPVVQINTGAGCHLDADMVHRALVALDPAPRSLLFIENVGNLVCPALFDLGEAKRVVLTSVTEGADKPLKYPHMFRGADVVLLNKMDLLPYVDFDVDRFSADVRMVNPEAEILPITATSATGIAAWLAWLGASERLS